MRKIPADLVRRYEEQGWWTRETLGDLLAAGLAASAEAGFEVHSAVRPWRGSFADVELVARRLAAGLRSRGVGPGDVVALQLPNWMEAAAAFWAAAFLGAVVVPVVHFYGPRELGFILSASRPRVFITAERFGRMSFRPELCADVPIIGVVGGNDASVVGGNDASVVGGNDASVVGGNDASVVGGNDASVVGGNDASVVGGNVVDFEDLLADEPMAGTLDADPAAPALIAFTSGTTREPKGVIHSHQTLCCETRQLLANYPKDRGRQLTATPVGHFIGMVGAFLIPVLEGAPIDLADVWDPAKVLALMAEQGVSIGGGPPYFVTSLLDHPDFTDAHLHHIRHVGLGGSTVPGAVTRRLADLGIFVFRSYGSTEHPSITGSRPSAPEDKRLFTDGDARPGVEVRLAPDGEILSRGPDLCLGYTDDALTAAAFDADGWYHTGDIGVLDADGYLTITDRKADVIIRGGENISAVEVEDVLLAMPAVAEAVVVAAPDARLGERAVAVLRLKPACELPAMSQVREHFERMGVARQKWPEELRQVEDFPRTASGKVQKYLVRKQLVEGVATAPL